MRSPQRTDSGTAVDAFDRATQSYLKYRTDAARHLGAALKADPQFALAYVLRGARPREAAYIEALARWRATCA